MTSITPDLNSPDLAPIKGQLARALIEHNADLGPAAAAASDQAVVDQVDDISELLLRGLATAMAQGNADWFSRYAWFVDLVSERLEDATGKPLDG